MNTGRSLGWLLGACLSFGCASGPHPAMELAARDFDCPMASLKRDEIYPNKQRIEGCNKEAVYVNDCGGYGSDAKCKWARAKSEF